DRFLLEVHRLVANLRDFIIVVPRRLLNAIAAEGHHAFANYQDEGEEEGQAQDQHRPSGPAANPCPSVHEPFLPSFLPLTIRKTGDYPRYHSPAPAPNGGETAGSFGGVPRRRPFQTKGGPSPPSDRPSSCRHDAVIAQWKE